MNREGHGGIARLLAAPLLLALAACGGHPKSAPEPIIQTIEVAVPVGIGCIPANLAAKPEYPDTDAALKAASGPALRYQYLYAGRKMRDARLAELEPIVAGCPKATPK